MTFFDKSQGRPTPGLIAGYSILAAISCLCAYWAVNLGRSRYHYRSFFSVRVLFPIALIILGLENAALAASGRVYDALNMDVEVEEGENSPNYDDSLFFRAIFVLQAFEVPILLVVIFEITYLVHKRRSVNFCGMTFDEGVRVKNTAAMSCMLRNSIRTLATLLLVMGLVVNFDFIHGDIAGDLVDDLAGRAGWWALKGQEMDATKVHLILSLIPTAVLTLVSFYLSIMLWRYGTESAMVVHSSICNPWFYSFFGTLAMAVGQVFGENLYTVMSNAGMLVFIITILLLMAEVDKDIVATNDVANFLVQVAQKGDQIRISSTAITAPQQQILQTQSSMSSSRPGSATAMATNKRDVGAAAAVVAAETSTATLATSMSREEEKMPEEDEETGGTGPSSASTIGNGASRKKNGSSAWFSNEEEEEGGNNNKTAVVVSRVSSNASSRGIHNSSSESPDESVEVRIPRSIEGGGNDDVVMSGRNRKEERAESGLNRSLEQYDEFLRILHS